MKTFLKTFTVIAAGGLLTTAALADEHRDEPRDTANEAGEWASERADEAADWATRTGERLTDAIDPDHSKLTAGALTSAELQYEGGSAPIRDLRMNADGAVEAIVVAHGGFLGMFGDEVAVDAVAASISHDADYGDVRVEAQVSEADMEAVTNDGGSVMALELVEERSDTALYYSDLSGAEIHGDNGEAIAVIRDIEISTEGRAEYAIVRDNGFFNILGETGRLPFSSLSVEHNGDGWEVHARAVSESDIERITSDDDAR
ncbi:PRC-barrel domain-containing protein [Glycocaulis sp.]